MNWEKNLCTQTHIYYTSQKSKLFKMKISLATVKDDFLFFCMS